MPTPGKVRPSHFSRPTPVAVLKLKTTYANPPQANTAPKGPVKQKYQSP